MVNRDYQKIAPFVRTLKRDHVDVRQLYNTLTDQADQSDSRLSRVWNMLRLDVVHTIRTLEAALKQGTQATPAIRSARIAHRMHYDKAWLSCSVAQTEKVWKPKVWPTALTKLVAPRPTAFYQLRWGQELFLKSIQRLLGLLRIKATSLLSR